LKSSLTVIQSFDSGTPGCSSQPLHWTRSVSSALPMPWRLSLVMSTRMPPLNTVSLRWTSNGNSIEPGSSAAGVPAWPTMSACGEVPGGGPGWTSLA
jgi:hypothetical protein